MAKIAIWINIMNKRFDYSSLESVLAPAEQVCEYRYCDDARELV